MHITYHAFIRYLEREFKDQYDILMDEYKRYMQKHRILTFNEEYFHNFIIKFYPFTKELKDILISSLEKVPYKYDKNEKCFYYRVSNNYKKIAVVTEEDNVIKTYICLEKRNKKFRISDPSNLVGKRYEKQNSKRFNDKKVCA